MIRRYSLLFILFLIVAGAGISSGLDVKYSTFENAVVNKILSSDKSLNKNEIKVTIKNFNEVKSRLSEKSYKSIKIDVNKKLNLVGSFPLSVFAVDKKGYVDKYYLLVKVNIDKRIIKAKNLIKRGTVITESDLIEERGNLAELPKGIVTSKQKIIGKESKFDIVSGRIILNYMVREIPLVKNKGEVIIVAKNDEFEVEVAGLALEDGGMGDNVKVKNLSSNSLIMARVIGKNKVAVSFE